MVDLGTVVWALEMQGELMLMTASQSEPMLMAAQRVPGAPVLSRRTSWLGFE